MGIRLVIAAIALVCCGSAVAQPLPKVAVGDNPSLSGAPLYIAMEKGYYRDAGVDVQLDMSGLSSDMTVQLATRKLNVIGGAITAGLFNSLAKGLPIGILMSRATSPYSHYLVIRPELKATLKQPADLKGRSVAVVSRGAILVYELIKVLEAGGLTLSDINLKYIPFGQMATALTTGAVDAALMISPLQDAVEEKGIGVKWINADSTIKAQPVLVSVWWMNSDWARDSEDAARRFVRGSLRGVRDYCNAYHGGSWRPELLKLLAANGVGISAEQIDSIPWASRSPTGFVHKDSATDAQRWYVQQGLVREELPFEKTVDNTFAENANKALGPFKLENAASKLKGCGK
jgi:NitT/TauT family transport system substrate-binding protein